MINLVFSLRYEIKNEVVILWKLNVYFLNSNPVAPDAETNLGGFASLAGWGGGGGTPASSLIYVLRQCCAQYCWKLAIFFQIEKKNWPPRNVTWDNPGSFPARKNSELNTMPELGEFLPELICLGVDSLVVAGLYHAYSRVGTVIQAGTWYKDINREWREFVSYLCSRILRFC